MRFDNHIVSIRRQHLAVVSVFLKSGKSIFFLCIVLSLTCCDYFRPQRAFVIAIPENDFNYNYAAIPFKAVLEKEGYTITIVKTKSVGEAVNLVQQNKVDLTMVMNHSLYLVDSTGSEAFRLRTILPLFRRFMFMYIRQDSIRNSISPEFLANCKIIGIEEIHGETQNNLQWMLDRAARHIEPKFTTQTPYDIYHIWGTAYSAKHAEMVKAGWKRVSLDEGWIRFIDVNNPHLHPISIPRSPVQEGPPEINTLFTETILLGSDRLGENSIYNLAGSIFNNKVHFLNYDRMYSTMDERFDKNELLYPLHEGTASYLNRNEPSFLERYSDALAFFATIVAFLYAGIQTIRNRISKKKKDQLDQYLMELLSIKENPDLSPEARSLLYDEMFKRVIKKVTNEKLETGDFHILSRLIQQEIANLRIKT